MVRATYYHWVSFRYTWLMFLCWSCDLLRQVVRNATQAPLVRSVSKFGLAVHITSQAVRTASSMLLCCIYCGYLYHSCAIMFRISLQQHFATTIIFTVSVYHAAIHSPQYEMYKYIPNTPAGMRMPIHKKGEVSARSLKCLHRLRCWG